MSTETDTTAEESATTREPAKFNALMIDPDVSRRELIQEIHQRLFDVDEIATALRTGRVSGFEQLLYRTQFEVLALFEELVEWDRDEMEPRASWVQDATQ